MGFGLNLGGALSGAGTGAAIGSAIPGVGTAIGAIGGGLLGLFSGGESSYKNQKKLMKQAWEYEKEGMGLQYGYNEQMAQANQQRSKDMWDYTNFENQRKHLENAGLSVGLMYGNGGTMQASTSGGQGQGVAGIKMNPVEAAIQSKALDIQMKQMESQTALNAASATKQLAEANKIKGVDTKETEANIENLIAQTNSEKEKRELIKQQTWTEVAQQELLNSTADMQTHKTDEIKWQIENYKKGIKKLEQEIIGAKIDNSYKAQVLEEQVKQASLTTAQMMKNLTKTTAETNQIAAEIQKMGWDVALKAEGNEIQWKELEQGYEKMLNDLEIAGEQINVAYKELIVEAIKGVAQAALGATAVKNALGGHTKVKGFGK